MSRLFQGAGSQGAASGSTQPDVRLGIDLGGTKIEGIVLSAEGHELARQRVLTPAGDYEATLAAITGLVQSLEAEAGVSAPALGLGTPGTVSRRTGLMKNCNSVCLNHHPLQQDLENRLGRPAYLANDADCFTLSEAVDGAGSDGRIVFGVILGTGVGGGLAVDRRLLAGPNGIAGEWGHNPLPQAALELAVAAGLSPQRDCYCGRRNCIEPWLCGPGLQRTYREFSGEAVDAQTVAARAAAGDAPAQRSLQLHAQQLALALAQIINILDPDVIVVGGGLSQLTSLYDAVPQHWQAAVFSDSVETLLRPARYGAASGVRGAAWLWPG